MSDEEGDICRVCRTNGTTERPLFHPCICIGSIKHVHQDCLTQWLRHSKKEYCELCKHKYSFKPIYSPDMPTRLPIKDLFKGLTRSIWSALKCWMHYTFVALAWLGIVPLTACRIFNCIFAGSLKSVLSFPFDMISTKHLGKHILTGFAIVLCCLAALLGLIWLRMQLLNGEMPEWIRIRPEADPAAPEEGLDEEDANEEEAEANVDDNNNEEEQAEEPVVAVQPIPPVNNNWNGLNWERGGDEPTWERILGLDGSLMFLEHVFWIMALNTLFILLFAFCPFHLGQILVIALGIQDMVAASMIEGIILTLCGYVIIAFGCLLAYLCFNRTKYQNATRICALCYLLLRVCIRLVVDLGLLPLLSGIWLDICSLKLFNSTLAERKESYLSGPGSSIGFHWLSGVIFIFYIAYFLVLLKDVLRPGALWFLYHIFSPDYNPVQAMIRESTYSHAYKCVMTVVAFGTVIIVVALLPVMFLNTVIPGFLPYKNGTQFASPIGDFPLQLLATQLILPVVLEQGFWKNHIQKAVKNWCKLFGGLLGIRSYLLVKEGIVDLIHRLNPNNAMLQLPYVKPRFFAVRLAVLLAFMCATLVLIFSCIITVPVALGRLYFRLCCGPEGPMPLLTHDEQPVHELYTFALGLWTIYSAIRLGGVVSKHAPFGWPVISRILRQFCIVTLKSFIVGIFIVVIIPLQLGVLFDLTIVVPLRVPLHQTPVIFLWQNWALGMLLQKLLLACIFLGPHNWLRDNIENAFEQGFLVLDIRKFVTGTLMLVVKFLLVCLALPYVIGHITALLFNISLVTKYFLHWRLYPCLIFGTAFFTFCWYELKQFRRLCDHIKNERYLIGKRLIDYDPPKVK